MPGRFAVITSLCVAIMLAVVVDRTHGSVGTWAKGLACEAIGPTWSGRRGRTGRGARRRSGPRRGRGGRGADRFGAGQQRPPHHPGGDAPRMVLRCRPAPPARPGGADLPGAVRIAAVGGGVAGGRFPSISPWWVVRGPEAFSGAPARSGRARRSSVPPPSRSTGHRQPTAANIDAVRQALAGWGVTRPRDSQPLVAAPIRAGDEPSLSPRPLHGRPRPPTACTRRTPGSGPTCPPSGRRLAISTAAFAGCTTAAAVAQPVASGGARLRAGRLPPVLVSLVTSAPERRPRRRRPRPVPAVSGGRPAVLGGAFAVYLVVSIVLWWHVWSSHPTTVTTCGCDDPSLFLWFLEWPAYALAHGHNPFYSTALFHPGGINLLSNTERAGHRHPSGPDHLDLRAGRHLERGLDARTGPVGPGHVLAAAALGAVDPGGASWAASSSVSHRSWWSTWPWPI